MVKHRISLCTVAMDRTHHLRQTLIRNMLDNRDYMDLEFILLDYHSKDGCETFVKQELSEFINDGILVYYRTTDPSFFHHSHSRNMAFRLATGDLLCNIDADNFTGEGFAFYLDKAFTEAKDIFLAAGRTSTDTLGRICLRKDDFAAIRGYDESMLGYGFEDLDLVNRLLAIGLKRIYIDNHLFLNVVKHGDWERISNKPEAKLLDTILVRQIDHTRSQLTFLLGDGVLHTGTVLENVCLNAGDPFNELMPMTCPYEYSLLKDDWQKGSWKKTAKGITVEYGENTTTLSTGPSEHYLLDGANKVFVVRPGTNLAEEGLFFYSQLSNRGIMDHNAKTANVAVNPGHFGKGVVTRNFDRCFSIE